MLGQIVYGARGDGRPRRGELAGLAVWRAEVPREGLWAGWRLRRAAGLLARAGVGRVLVPGDFSGWEALARRGLGPVDPLPFLRAHGGELALAALAAGGIPAGEGTVALRGQRVDRDMVRAAEFLCPRVRELAISAPVGGGELAGWLRREYGMPVCPDGGGPHAAVRFHPETEPSGEFILDLFGSNPGLAGLRMKSPEVELPEGDPAAGLSLMAALWEAGKIQNLEFT